MTTEPSTINDFDIELRLVDHPTAGETDTVPQVSGDLAVDGARHRSQRAAVVAAIAGLVVAAGAGALLVVETISAPDVAPIPAPMSPSDQALGYLLSADFPADVDTFTGAQLPSEVVTASPSDQALGYLLSADFPALACDSEGQGQVPSDG